MAMDLGEIMAIAHLTADALIIVDPYSIGFQSTVGCFLIKQVDAALDRTMRLAYEARPRNWCSFRP